MSYLRGCLMSLLAACRGAVARYARKSAMPLVLAFMAAQFLPESAPASGGAMKVGVNMDRAPLAWRLPSGVFNGLAVDIALAIDDRMNEKTQFYEGAISDLIKKLNETRIDYACGLSITDFHSSRLIWIPVGIALNRRIITTSVDSPIESEKDFRGRRIAVVIRDGKYRDAVRFYGGQVVDAVNTLDALGLLERGEADAFPSPLGEAAAKMAHDLGMKNIVIKGKPLGRTQIGLILCGDDHALRARINTALHELEKNGALEKIREKWLGHFAREPESVWEKYGAYLLCLIGCVAFFAAAISVWNYFLRLRVAQVTKNLAFLGRQYRALTEAIPEMIMLVDADCRVHFANSAAYDNLGLRKGSHLTSPPDVSGQGAPAALRDLTAQALRDGMARGELKICMKNGAAPVEFIGFKHSWDKLPLACLIGRDMSQRQAMERELAKSERLALIGQLAAGVAHEINNPLGIIMANAELLAQDVSSPMLDAILRNVGRASDITRGLLNLAAREKSGNETFDLGAVIRESLDFIRPRLKNVEICLDIPEPFPTRGDKNLIQQLILNLLLNALDSMRDRGRLGIKGRECVDGLALAVEDSGEGIDRENLETVFKIFHSAKGKKGFGLGLYVARNIAELHGGMLWAESERGNGSTFYLELPASPFSSPRGQD